MRCETSTIDGGMSELSSWLCECSYLVPVLLRNQDIVGWSWKQSQNRSTVALMDCDQFLKSLVRAVCILNSYNGYLNRFAQGFTQTPFCEFKE